MKKSRPQAKWKWTTTPFAKQLFSVSRMLHLYISAALFSLLVFFCFTGITLNHSDWVSQGEDRNTSFALPFDTTGDQYQLDATPLIAELNRRYALGKPKEISVDLDMREVTLDYSVPAGYAFVTWFIEEGWVEIEYQQGTMLSIMNDLHKGRHSGFAWRWVIDISAVLMLLFAVTGLIILLQQIKRRQTGLWCVFIGTLTPFVVYLLWVPRF